MEPNFEQTEVTYKRSKTTQILIVILLLVVLIGVVIGYIYIGMNRAKNVEIAPEPVVENETDEYQAMLKALETATSSVSDEEKDEIMKALSEPSSVNETRISDEDRTEILKALEQSAPAENL